MAFNFKTTKEIEEANKQKAQDEQSYRNFETYTPQQYQQSQGLQDMWSNISNWQTPTWNKEDNTYWNKLTNTMNAIENRKKFEYDLNGDMLYQQYKDQYTTQGKMASADVMGQAAALTGGYGNSYAQTVGQQTYQGYLQQLNDKVPELYQLALDQYNREGDDLYNRLSMYGSMYDTEYGEHRDAVADSKDQLAQLTNLYGIKSGEEYGQWYDSEQMKQTANQQELEKLASLLGISTENAERLYNQAYQSQYDTYNTDFSEKQFTYQQEQDAIANQLAREQLEEQKRANKASEDVAWYNATKSSGGGGGGNSPSYAYDTVKDFESTILPSDEFYDKAKEGTWQTNKKGTKGETKYTYNGVDYDNYQAYAAEQVKKNISTGAISPNVATQLLTAWGYDIDANGNIYKK